MRVAVQKLNNWNINMGMGIPELPQNILELQVLRAWLPTPAEISRTS